MTYHPAERLSPPLAERLLRRATRPAGVIDVRGPQQRYQSAMSWPRLHVTLLDRWLTRHSQQGQGDESAEDGFATRRADKVLAFDMLQPVHSSLPPAAPFKAGPQSVSEAPPSRDASGGHAAARRQDLHVGPAMRVAPLARARAPLAASRGAERATARSVTPADPGFDSRSDFVQPAAAVGSATRPAPNLEANTVPPAARLASSPTMPVDVQSDAVARATIAP